MKYFIDGIEITDDLIGDLPVIQSTGILGDDSFNLVYPENVSVRVDNQDGKFDADYQYATWGPGNDIVGKVLHIEDDFSNHVWAGYIQKSVMNDLDKTVQISALSWIGKIYAMDMTYPDTTDTPATILQDILENYAQIAAVWINQASFASEIAFDTANSLSLDLEIPAGSEVPAIDVIKKILLIFNKRIYVYRNQLFISHIFEYTGSNYRQFPESDILIREEILRYRDHDRVCNSVNIAYNNAGTLAWVSRDLTDVGKSLAEYQQHIRKYGVKYFFKEDTFLLDRDGATVMLAHSTSASAQYIADQALTIFGDAPLILQFYADLQTTAQVFRWNDLHCFAPVMVSLSTPWGISYSNEPCEIEYKHGRLEDKIGTIKLRFVDKYPKRFTTDYAKWEDGEAWEVRSWGP